MKFKSELLMCFLLLSLTACKLQDGESNNRTLSDESSDADTPNQKNDSTDANSSSAGSTDGTIDRNGLSNADPLANFVVSRTACLSDQAIADSAAEYVLASRAQVQEALKPLSAYTKLAADYFPAGAVYDNASTADRICQFMGYKSSAGTVVARFSSCSDNDVAFWNNSARSFTTSKACPPGMPSVTDLNRFIAKLTCKAKLVTPCVNSKAWVTE